MLKQVNPVKKKPVTTFICQTAGRQNADRQHPTRHEATQNPEKAKKEIEPEGI